MSVLLQLRTLPDSREINHSLSRTMSIKISASLECNIHPNRDDFCCSLGALIYAPFELLDAFNGIVAVPPLSQGMLAIILCCFEMSVSCKHNSILFQGWAMAPHRIADEGRLHDSSTPGSVVLR
jgi:hypothetical protein